MRERTRQQLDPVGSGEGRRLWVLLAAGCGVYTVIMVLLRWASLDRPWLGALGAASAVLGSALAILWTTDRLAPFTRRRHLVIHILALTTLAATLWAHHDRPFQIGAAFATLTIAGLIVAVSPYRPSNELVTVGLTTATIAGFLILTALHRGTAILPELVVVLGAVCPIVALTLGAAAYTDSILRSIESSSTSTLAPSRTDDNEHRDRVAVMTQDALPLLTRVLDSGHVTAADRHDAARTAQTLRAMLVTEINRTWLHASQDERPGPRFTISDPESLARNLNHTRRTLLRALLDALAGEPGFVRGTISLSRDDAQHQLSIEANYDADEYTTPPGHPTVSALLTVMGSVYTELGASRTQTRVLVTFSYEQE